MTFVCWRVYDVCLLEGLCGLLCWRVYDVCLLEGL